MINFANESKLILRIGILNRVIAFEESITKFKHGYKEYFKMFLARLIITVDKIQNGFKRQYSIK